MTIPDEPIALLLLLGFHMILIWESKEVILVTTIDNRNIETKPTILKQ